MKKILLLGNSKLTIFGFRGELIEQLIEKKYEVVTVFPNGPFGEGEKVSKEYGCKFVQIEIDRRGTNPIGDLKLLKNYISIIKKEKPNIVLAFTAKCDIYGGIACRLLKIPFVPNITGLGKGLTEGKLTKLITKNLYKFAIKKSKCVFFQNEGDKEFFINNKIKFKKSIVLPGSGVNIDKFKVLDYPNDDIIRFIYVARIMKVKGIDEYLGAATEIKKKYKNTEFHICGFYEEDYKDIIEKKQKDNTIIYHGLVDDVKLFEKDCHCIVLPSYHPEGISNVLLEAAALGRAIITTNRIGCKETVDNGVSGYLINEKDTNDLINKMTTFIELNNKEKKEMGLSGRKKIEKEFDRNIVVNKYLMIISEEN